MQRTLLNLLRWCVFLFACAYVFRQWQAHESTFTGQWHPAWADSSLHLLVVLLGVPLNWGIETWKWRLMLREVQPMSFARAYAGVLAGCGISLITPNRTGEFLGRVLVVEPAKRIDATLLSVLASLSQLVATLTCGAAAGLVWWLSGRPSMLEAPWHMTIAVLVAVLVSATIALLLTHPGWLRARLLALRPVRRWSAHLEVLAGLPLRRVVVVQGLSLLRYLVFVGQFALLLEAFDAGGEWNVWWLGIPVVYLLATLVPTVMFTELGVRAGVAVLVLGALGADAQAVTVSASLLWTLNVLLPAVAGSVVLLMLRIRTQRPVA